MIRQSIWMGIENGLMLGLSAAIIAKLFFDNAGASIFFVLGILWGVAVTCHFVAYYIRKLKKKPGE